MSEHVRPEPSVTDVSRPHWEGCARGELLVQRCADCERYVFIPAPRCPYCQSGALVWVKSTGLGTVYSYTVVWRPQSPAFEVPYVPAIVHVDEDWHMFSNIVGCPVDAVDVGMRVEVTFLPVSDRITLPAFRPV